MEKRKLKIILIALITLTILNIGVMGVMVNLYLQSKQKMQFKKECIQRPPKLDQLLEFDELQKEQFQNLRNIHKSAVRPLRKQTFVLRESLLGEITSPNPDTLMIQQLNRELGSIHIQMQDLLAKHLISVRAICNENQYRSFDTTIARFFISHDDCRMHPNKHRNPSKIHPK